MTRFPFSLTGRRKQPPRPPAHLPPTSKAHKILGSTPLSIDAPPAWNDASSFAASDFTSATTAATYSALDLEADEHDDQQVVIADDDDDDDDDDMWDRESAVKNDFLLDPVNFSSWKKTAPTATTARLRKSQSSSTIFSWHDGSKSPPSNSQKTSSPTMARAFPSHSPLGLGLLLANKGHTTMTKKKPSRRHVFHTTAQEHDRLENDLSTTSGMDRLLRCPSRVPSIASLSTQGRQSRPPSKRNTTDHLQVPVPEAVPSLSHGAARLGRGTLRHSPSLYDHYEQMSIQRLLRQSSTPNLQVIEDEWPDLQNFALQKCVDKSIVMPSRLSSSTAGVPETAKTMRVSIPNRQSSRGLAAQSAFSRRSTASKAKEMSLEGRDLRQDSVLMLSSDSAEEEELGRPAAGQSPASLSSRGRRNGAGISPRSKTRSSTNREASSGANGGTICSTRQSNSTGVASSDVCTNSPSSEYRRTGSGLSGTKRPPALRGDQRPTVAPSISSSVTSGRSTSSAVTWQDECGFDMGEAPATVMLSARRPSNVDSETRIQASSSASSGGQLTPPLSPTSVDFYIHSTQSSIDGLVSQSRLMAVTEQEEMFLSALRHKHQTRSQAPMSLVSKEDAQKMVPADLAAEDETTDAKDHGYISGPKFDFGFPTPPSFRKFSNLQQRRATDPSKRAVSPIRTSGPRHGGAVMPSSPSGPPPTISLPSLPKEGKSKRSPSCCTTDSTPSQQDVPFFDDDIEPSPDLEDIRDWESATSQAAGPRRSAAPRITPGRKEGNQGKGGDKTAQSAKTDSPAFLHPGACSKPNGKKQDLVRSGKAEGEDVPRPDSPISPETLLPTGTHTARSCAVEGKVEGFGWWGDDD